MLDTKREVYIDNNIIYAKTSEMDGFRYGFYLIVDDQIIERNNYSREAIANFELAPFYGNYKMQFFYKNSQSEEVSVIEKFSIIEKAGKKIVIMNESDNFFLDANNEPITKRLVKNISVQEKILKKEAKKLGDSYPGKRFDIVIMTLPTSETLGSEYLFIAIDSFSKEMYFDIHVSTSYIHIASFIENLVVECPYYIDQINIDNTLQIKGLSKLNKLCKKVGIKCDLVPMDQFISKSKSLAVIDGLIKELYRDTTFESKRELVKGLITLTNKYNFFEKNIEVGDISPYQKLEKYFC